MRVAHVLRKYDPSEWGGTETVVRDLLGGLRARGVESVVYAPKLAHADGRNVDLLAADGHDVRRFRAFLPVLGLRAEDRRRLVSVGGNLVSMTLPVSLYREPALSVLHTHALQRLGGIASRVAHARRIPLVVTIHGGYRDLPASVREDLRRPMRGGLEYGRAFGALVGARRVVRDADAVLTCNSREAELLQEEVPRDRIHHLPHGIPTADYAVDRRADARPLIADLDAEKILLSVGRIDTVKNQLALVEALDELRRTWPRAHLVLVGPVTDAEYSAKIEARVAELRLADRVRFVGPLPPRDPRLVGLYQHADVVLLPSLSETFGIVILEAWAAGTCVVASRTSGAVDLVTDGTNGLLHDVGDRAGLVAALHRVLLRPSFAAELGEHGRAKAVAEYDRAAIAGRVLDLYRSLGAR